MKTFSITSPTLILDKTRVLANIERMVSKANASQVFFRPHCKTHQSAEIGRWFKDFGINACTVSSVDMAKYFADNGWQDITIAFPVNILELDKIASLAESISLGVLVDSGIAVDALRHELTSSVYVWIKIDTGYQRTGIPWDHIDHIVPLAQKIRESPKLTFAGILTHNGLTYRERTPEGIQRIHQESVSRMKLVKDAILQGGVEICAVSIGDTPSCSIVDDFSGIDEIRPGNFVFYDIMQTFIGSCSEEDITVTIACPVVGKYPHRKEIAIYGGAIHLSKEHIIDDNDRKIFGYLSTETPNSLGTVDYDAPVVSLTQEHGIVNITEELLSTIEIGDIVTVFPIHSCLTASLYSKYLTIDGYEITRM